MEGGGSLLPDDKYTNTRRPIAEVLWGDHPDKLVPPVENPMFSAFEEYEKLPETLPLEFKEDGVTWFASKLSSAAGALGAGDIELMNWIFYSGCASEALWGCHRQA